MEKLTFTIDINAPKQKVWEVMLDDATYRQWTAPFHEGSYFEGSWEKGSDIRFLGPDNDGKKGGMISKIVENTPYEYLSIEHVGEIIDGVDHFDSPWAGGHENYRFTENNGVTTLDIELETKNPMDPAIAAMFKDMWPQALAKLKAIAEQ